jgi:CBS domain-containing protein
MESLRIHRLVVVDDRDEILPIGVLSLNDIVHAIADGTDVRPVAPATEASDA